MIRFASLAALSSLLALTSPNGQPVWISSEQVAAVLTVHGVGATDTAIILTSGTTIYVRESASAVALALVK